MLTQEDEIFFRKNWSVRGRIFFLKARVCSQLWWGLCIPGLGDYREGAQEFKVILCLVNELEASLGYMRPRLKI